MLENWFCLCLRSRKTCLGFSSWDQGCLRWPFHHSWWAGCCYPGVMECAGHVLNKRKQNRHLVGFSWSCRKSSTVYTGMWKKTYWLKPSELHWQQQGKVCFQEKFHVHQDRLEDTVRALQHAVNVAWQSWSDEGVSIVLCLSATQRHAETVLSCRLPCAWLSQLCSHLPTQSPSSVLNAT